MPFHKSVSQIIRLVFNSVYNFLKVGLVNSSGESIDVQHPLPCDGDSVYVKDLDLSVSDNYNFSGSVTDYFDSLTTVNTDSTGNNPKQILLWFKRTVYAHAIGFGCNDLTKGFGSSITIKLLGSGQAVRFQQTYSPSDPNSFLAEFGPKAFNGVLLEFNTANEVCLSNITIQKSLETSATIQGLNPQGEVVNFDATAAGNFKVSIEEFENDVSTNNNAQLNVSPYLVDEFGNYAHMLCDNFFRGAPIVIDSAHHEIHCGDSYEATHNVTLPNGGVLDILIIVPNETGTGQNQKLYHLKDIVEVENECIVTLYEGTTVSANGTAITSYNRERNSILNDVLGIFHTPTITAVGTMIWGPWILGSGRAIGGDRGRENEFVLKNDTIYLLRVANNSVSNCWVNVELDYYVHPGV